MAASNDPPSPRSRTLEASNAYDDEWKQAEDHDWPTQLISSIEHDPHLGAQDHVESIIHAEADEAVLGSVSSGGSGRSSQQASQQVSQQAPMKLLARPVSSGKDPAAGFSFTKAKPMQQLDFRRPKQTLTITHPQDLPPPSMSTPTELDSHRTPPLQNTAQAVQTVVDVAAHQGPSPKYPGKNPLAVPFPNVTPALSRAYNHPTSNTTSGPGLPNSFSTRAQLNEVSISADDDTLADSNLERNGSCLQSIQYSSHGKPGSIDLVSNQSPAAIVEAVDQPHANMQNRSRKPSRDPLTSVAGASKVIKSRRKKTKMGPVTNDPPAPLNPKDTYTEDDLLKLLMYRRRLRQQELEYFRATQQQKEAEIQKLHDITTNLHNQLQEVEQRETQKTTELSKIKANKPIWESKIKRLVDYVKGLTNDHNRLRDDADDLHKQHKDVYIARKELHNILDDARTSAEQERIRSRRIEDDARHRIEALTQTVQHQNTQLQNDENLLMAGRERSNRLEDQISRITASHGQLLELFTGHRDTITGKIDDLLHQAQSIVPPTKASESDSHNPLRPMLEQCVRMLQELHKVDTVKPEDLRRLNDTMDSFVEGIAHSVEACEESSNTVETEQKQLGLAMQEQFRALSGNLFSEHALSEQISSLREVKATFRERLQATESSLADARREVVALGVKDQEKSRRIVFLETIAARAQSQSAEAPQTLLRIQELDSRNQDLQSEIVTLKKEATDLSSQLQQSSTDLTITQEQLEAAKEDTARSREEMSTSERHAILEREQLRKELSKAANMQLANMQNEHVNVLQQLKSEKSSAEEKLKNVTRQFNMLKVEKEKSEKESAQLQVLLKGVQSEKDAIIGTRKGLQLHLKEMEARMHEKNIEYGDLHAMLNKANDQVKAKDLKIIALQASQTTRSSSSKVTEQSPSVRGVQSIRNRHALHRDSQPISIDPNPSVQPTSHESSRHFTNQPPVVEDSQPRDSQPKNSQPTVNRAFVSLGDLMLDDPFASYAPEGPQTVGGEDISLLFPSTPGVVSRAQDLDYSRKSVIGTTVVSGTQRRQHQSSRENATHTGTDTMSKPPTQSQARTYSKTGNNHAMPKSSMATSPTKITTPRRGQNIPSSHKDGSITRESTQLQGSVRDPRQGKRNTVAAGFNETNPQARPSKVQKAEPMKKALGPIIEDSQSPLLNGRSRKMTRRKSSAPKDDKFTRRFAQA